jgi:hypothetical protein
MVMVMVMVMMMVMVMVMVMGIRGYQKDKLSYRLLPTGFEFWERERERERESCRPHCTLPGHITH